MDPPSPQSPFALSQRSPGRENIPLVDIHDCAKSRYWMMAPLVAKIGREKAHLSDFFWVTSL